MKARRWLSRPRVRGPQGSRRLQEFASRSGLLGTGAALLVTRRSRRRATMTDAQEAANQ